MSNDDHSSTGEWINFGILVVVLMGTILVVALLRPIIFGKIVPAVMGDNLEQSAVIEPATIQPPQPPLVLPPSEEAPAEETPAESPAEPSPAPESLPSPVPLLTHTVRPSENLTHIARTYGVTVEALVAANNITNPNRIDAGTVLIIPAP